MNFLNDKKLARRLKAGEVSTKEHFYYLFLLLLIGQFLATSFIASITYSPIYIWGKSATDILYLASAFFGIILIYNTNRQGDNKEFIERFICLSLPTTIHLTLIFLPAHLIHRFFLLETIGTIFYNDAFSLVLNVFYNAYFYLRLNYLMKIASH